MISRGAYRPIIACRVREALVFRANSIMLGAGALIQIFLVNAVWTAAHRSGTFEQPLEPLLIYVTLAGLHAWLLSGSVLPYVQRQVNRGAHIFEILRPSGYLSQIAAHQLGLIAGALLFIVPALPIALLVGSLSLPHTVVSGLLYVVSLTLGLGIHILLCVLVGLSAFWTLQIDGLTLLYRIISQFFAGTFAPLSLFPGWLAEIADLLPFQATTYVPITVYLGEVSGADALWAVAHQLLWLAALTLAAIAVWRRARRRVVVQGG
ncbi:ABC transporter permease [Streptomyces sp. NBC_00525]|uniref:ABC transporter permease n=1 Tax=Streptomyces sp. NBC_00525 TaxID=2903660 RepID=UPI002E817CF3|nr:ABC-2 family transporter protein [Streptomyces sp. NBC_00525]WUC96531.1 ABC-2 family transporter protein [Streptomyces sp. NBC_00525]